MLYQLSLESDHSGQNCSRDVMPWPDIAYIDVIYLLLDMTGFFCLCLAGRTILSCLMLRSAFLLLENPVVWDFLAGSLCKPTGDFIENIKRLSPFPVRVFFFMHFFFSFFPHPSFISTL